MLPILTAEEMSRADRAAIEQLSTGEVRLMELAGREASRILSESLNTANGKLDDFAFLIVCGKGNNGGDGFVLARHLLNLGAEVDVLLLYPSENLSGLNREGLAIVEAYAANTDRIRIFKSHDEALPFVAERQYDGVVDAILGTGLRLQAEGDALRNPVKQAVELTNSIRERSPAVTIALDLPSGLDATSGFASSPAVRADLTVSMAYLKTGFFFNSGPRLSGELHIAEISIPEFLVKQSPCHLVDEAFAADHFLLRDPDGAKHNNGKLLVIAGSQNHRSSMLGACLLATKAAIGTGAGYVCVSLPPELAGPLHTAAPSATVTGRDIDSLLEKASWANAIVLGCGLGRDKETIALLHRLLAEPAVASKKLVLDADALFALSEEGFSFGAHSFRDVILTPHLGEFSRLTGLSISDIQADSLGCCRDFTKTNNVNLLLKGNPTCIVNPCGEVLLNKSGTEALSTAGTGDVLAGMIGALAAKGVDTFHAGAAAAWFHGRAGDLACDVASLVSSEDVLRSIPEAVREVFFIEEEQMFR